MAGTRRGGKLAALENMRKYGPDFYKKIGAMGGKASGTGGFYANRELASIAGRRGGLKSRKGGGKIDSWNQQKSPLAEKKEGENI